MPGNSRPPYDRSQGSDSQQLTVDPQLMGAPGLSRVSATLVSASALSFRVWYSGQLPGSANAPVYRAGRQIAMRAGNGSGLWRSPPPLIPFIFRQMAAQQRHYETLPTVRWLNCWHSAALITLLRATTIRPEVPKSGGVPGAARKALDQSMMHGVEVARIFA